MVARLRRGHARRLGQRRHRLEPLAPGRRDGEVRHDRHDAVELEGAQSARGDAQPCVIAEATQAAPKPLSMFTTDTPFAQLFSMPSSAATPPKLAP